MKKGLAIFLTAAMMLGIAACSKTDTTTNQTEAQTEAQAEETSVFETGDDSVDERNVQLSGSLTEYIGFWEYDNYYIWMQINDNNTWTYYDGMGNVFDVTYEMNGDAMLLKSDTGADWMELTIENDVITDSDGDTLRRSSLPEYYGYLGVWEYSDYDIWFQINPDETFSIYGSDGIFVADDGTSFENFPFDMVDGNIRLLNNDEQSYLYIFSPYENDDTMLIDDEGDTLFRSELPESAN